MRYMSFLPPFYSVENWGTHKLSDLLSVKEEFQWQNQEQNQTGPEFGPKLPAS